MRILEGASRRTAEAVGLLRAAFIKPFGGRLAPTTKSWADRGARRPEEMITMSGADWFSRCGAPTD